MTPEGFACAAELLAAASRVVVSTGAGMSRESGIPTFRDGQEGLWAKFSPQELATEAGFRAAPERVWSWYAERRRRIAGCTPHPGYAALVRLAAMVPELVVVTQNIDNLHRCAGSADVIELHGNIQRFKCLDGGHPLAEELAPEAAVSATPPRCAECGSPLRPDVVWFGEMLPADAVSRAQDLAERCDLMLVVGTSGTVWPAAELPHLARRAGAVLIEVNLEASELTPIVQLFLRGPAGSLLPALVDAVAERLPGDC